MSVSSSFLRFILTLVWLASLPIFSLRADDIARISSSDGEFDIQLFRSQTPLTVQNFLNYVRSGRYDSSIIHRGVPGFVLQGGGYGLKGNNLYKIPPDAPVANEPGISNLRGTVAMAKLGGDPNSATSEWFINMADNSANLDAQNGGFTVFGKLVGNGMAVADKMAGYSVYNVTTILGGAFGELPLRAPTLNRENLILYDSVRILPEGTLVKDFDFLSESQGFVGAFADLPVDYEPSLYQLTADHRALPPELGEGKGLFLSGSNLSDELWMCFKKKITGLQPNMLYEVVVDLEMGSNAPLGLSGVGGFPGDSVLVKAGAASAEPMVVADSDGWLRWSVDKGTQAIGGVAASVMGSIAKPSGPSNVYAKILRNNRSSKLTATSAADGSLWLFFGTDSGFQGKTSVYITRATAVFAPVMQLFEGEFIGNFQTDSLRGRLSVKLDKKRAFTGSLVTPLGTSTLRGKLDNGGNAIIPIGPSGGTLKLILQAGGLSDGVWDSGDSVYLSGLLKFGDMEASIICRPTPRTGGPEAPMAGKTINTLFESHNESGLGFGFGFASVKPGKDGVCRFSGSLADGTKLSGSARVVEDGEGGWKLPVAIPLTSVRGFLHGEAVIDSQLEAVDFHLKSEAPWTWTCPANAKAKSFPVGFTEKLNVRGREWTWTKGNSALEGNSANFTMDFKFENQAGGFIPVAGVDGMFGTLGSSNKPVWRSSPPKGFSMIITPATGLVSGKIPGTQNGRTEVLSYQGMLFPGNMLLESSVSARGAGFIFSDQKSLGSLLIKAP